MTTTAQPESRVASLPAQAGRESRRISARQRALRGCFAEWRNFSPQLDWECTDREARLRFANEVLATRHSSLVTSWGELTTGQAKRLQREMKERSGSNAAYRASLIARLAVELFGHDWNNIVRERLGERFQLSTLNSLTAAQAHSMIEELLSRLARREGIEIEEVRARFARRKAESRRQKAGEIQNCQGKEI
jgi:hypothetical protein